MFPGISAPFERIGLAVDTPESSYAFVETPGVSGIENSDPFRFFDLTVCTWAVVVEIFEYAELRSYNAVVGFVEVFGHDGSIVLTSTLDVRSVTGHPGVDLDAGFSDVGHSADGGIRGSR